MCMDEIRPGYGLPEGRGGLLVLIDGLYHMVSDPWCSRGPRRAPVAAIFRWAATRIGTIGGPSRTGVGLHALHARTVRTALGYREGHRSGGRRGPCVPGSPLQTEFGHCPVTTLNSNLNRLRI